MAQKELVDRIFSGVGIAHWLAHEDLIDTVTALSGSGPAYFFLLMELMQKAGEDLGLDRETARALTLQTALGAATMAGAQTADAARLRQQVTSPGGTTERAILSFQKAGLEKIVREAMQGAKLRAAEMAAEFSR